MLGLALLTLVVGISWYGIHRSGLRLAGEEEMSVCIQLRSSDHSVVQRGRERVIAYDREMSKILDKYPELRPKWKNVSPEENGYLRLMQLSDRYVGKLEPLEALLDFPNEVSDAIYQLDWKTEAIGEYLSKEAELLSELRAIGMMPDQSIEGVDIDCCAELYPASFTKQCADLLCLDARYAAKEGDGSRAVTSILAAYGMARHFSQIETPSLHHETVGILVALMVLDTAVNEVIPELQLSKSEISELRKKLRPVTNEDFSRVIEGELYVGMRACILPCMHQVGDIPALYKIPDPSNFYAAYIGHIKHWSNVQSWLSLRGSIEGKGGNWVYKFPGKMSSQTQGLINETITVGLQIYNKGHARTKIVYRYYDAVLAIAAGEEPPVELLTGKPFIFDPETRELRLPADSLLDAQGVEVTRVP